MNKPFCDICESPADSKPGVKSSIMFGRKHLSPHTDTKLVKTEAVATVHFGFQNHESGYGGPPDLCTKCRRELVKKLLESLA